jgi:hypothetical protein
VLLPSATLLFDILDKFVSNSYKIFVRFLKLTKREICTAWPLPGAFNFGFIFCAVFNSFSGTELHSVPVLFWRKVVMQQASSLCLTLSHIFLLKRYLLIRWIDCF